MEALVAASAARLSGFSAAQLAVLLSSLRSVHYRPGEAFLDGVLRALERRRRHLRPEQAAAAHRALLYMDRRRAAQFAGQVRLQLQLGRARAGGRGGAVLRVGRGGGGGLVRGSQAGSRRHGGAAGRVQAGAEAGQQQEEEPPPQQERAPQPGPRRQHGREAAASSSGNGARSSSNGNGAPPPAAEQQALPVAISAAAGLGYSFEYSSPRAQLALSSMVS
jgi:hypothetical protein